MQISSSSWHARVYEWWRRRTWETPNRDNLCLYVRVVLLWAPLRWLFAQGEIGSIHVAIFSWPILLGIPLIVIHDWEVLFLVLLLYVSFVLTGLILGGIIVGVNLQSCEFPKPIESFVRVLREYRKAVHDRICPFVEFK